MLAITIFSCAFFLSYILLLFIFTYNKIIIFNAKVTNTLYSLVTSIASESARSNRKRQQQKAREKKKQHITTVCFLPQSCFSRYKFQYSHLVARRLYFCEVKKKTNKTAQTNIKRFIIMKSSNGYKTKTK